MKEDRKIKKKYRYSIIIAGILFLSLSGVNNAQQIGQPFGKYYSSQEYQGGIQNWRINQNKEGIIYIANNFGLLEYDGNSWNRFQTPMVTKLRDVSFGASGIIYVASQGDFGYFVPDMTGKLTYFSLADSLPEKYRNFDEAWRIFFFNDHLIFCTFKQLFVFDQSGKFLYTIDPEYEPENFFQVSNRIYINQLEVGLSVLNGQNKLELMPHGDFFKGVTITGIIPLANQRLWIATRHDGIYIYDGLSYKLWESDHQDLFKSAAINEAIRLSNGDFVIGTQNEGFYILDQYGKFKMHMNKGSSPNTRTVLSLFEDQQGNLWVGHNNGISCIELSLPFRHINEQEGVQGTGYDAYLDDKILYLGTNNGLYAINISHEEPKPELVKNTEGQIYHISRIRQHMLVGHHEGAFRLTSDKAEQFSGTLGAWTFISPKSYPSYIIEGTYKGLLLHQDNGDQGVSFLRKLKGFDESSRVMQMDEEGDIWMTHGYKGVYRIRLNETLDSVNYQYYNQQSGLPSNLSINVWKINNRLLFTSEDNVYRYDAESDRFVLDEEFSPYFRRGTALIKMQEDPLGNVFYLSSEESGVLKKQVSGGYEKESAIFNRIRGLLNDDLLNMNVINSNEAIFAAKEGFILYRMEDNPITRHDFTALIRKVWVGIPEDSLIATGIYLNYDKVTFSQPKDQVPELDFAYNKLHFQFSSTFLDTQQKTTYQYMLEGLDDHWSEWTEKPDKEYTNLREGFYTFKVRARNIYQKESKIASYSFYISPPWYRSNMAYALYFLMFATLIASIFYWTERKYRKKTARLTQKQKLELSKKENALKSSEEQIEMLKSEKLQAEIKSKNQELATSTMHLINKNEFINGMKQTLGNIIKRSKNQEVKNEISKLIQNIEKNIQQDDDWEHFAIHFDEVHGDFLQHLKNDFPNLSPQEMKLSAYLRMNLSTKEIAQLLNISVRGVEIARYRLRKKLDLDRSVNLQEFILKY